MRASSKRVIFGVLMGLIAAPVAAFADDDWEDDERPSAAPPPPAGRPLPPMAMERPPPPNQSYAPGQRVDGQWVFTHQYGWTWIPYEREYTYVDPGGSIAYSYVYYPSAGWSWVLSPWVLGYGPGPRWGNSGYSRFAWHSRPWFRVGPRWTGPSYAGHYANGRVVVHTAPTPRYRQAPTVIVRPSYRQAPTVIVRPSYQPAPTVVARPNQPAPNRGPGRAPPRGPRGPGNHGDRQRGP